jgi:hypothetical protein
MIANGLAVLMLGLMVAIILATSGSLKAGVVTLALAAIAGAIQFFGGILRDQLTRSLGRAVFQDPPGAPFDADAAFERAMRKRASRTENSR